MAWASVLVQHLLCRGPLQFAFCATADAIRWLSDTPSCRASRAAALTAAGGLRGLGGLAHRGILFRNPRGRSRVKPKRVAAWAKRVTLRVISASAGSFAAASSATSLPGLGS